MNPKQFGDFALVFALADILDYLMVDIVQIPGNLADQIPELRAVFDVQIPSIPCLIYTHLHRCVKIYFHPNSFFS